MTTKLNSLLHGDTERTEKHGEELLINGIFAFWAKISKDKIIVDKMILELFCR
jgi:hypothetical protein